MDEIVSAMIEHMKQQIENPALRDSKFVFDSIIHMDIDFHRLTLLPAAFYDFLSYGFLSHTSGKNVKII